MSPGLENLEWFKLGRIPDTRAGVTSERIFLDQGGWIGGDDRPYNKSMRNTSRHESLIEVIWW